MPKSSRDGLCLSHMLKVRLCVMPMRVLSTCWQQPVAPSPVLAADACWHACSGAADGAGTHLELSPLLLCHQPLRLLAVVIAKNTIGSSWRKTLGTREWSRVPDEEKRMVRGQGSVTRDIVWYQSSEPASSRQDVARPWGHMNGPAHKSRAAALLPACTLCFFAAKMASQPV